MVPVGQGEINGPLCQQSFSFSKTNSIQLKALTSFINSHPHQSRAYLTHRQSSIMSWFPYKSSIDRLQISL